MSDMTWQCDNCCEDNSHRIELCDTGQGYIAKLRCGDCGWVNDVELVYEPELNAYSSQPDDETPVEQEGTE